MFYAPEARQYRTAALPFVQAAAKTAGTYEGGVLLFTAHAYDRFFNLDGSIKDVDIDNSLKLLVDSVFEPFDKNGRTKVKVLGLRDSVIFQVALHKHHTTKEPYTRVRVQEFGYK